MSSSNHKASGTSFPDLMKDLKTNGAITRHFMDCYSRITQEATCNDDYVARAFDLTGDLEHAHDVVAEMFKRALEHPDDLLPEQSVNDWLNASMDEIIIEQSPQQNSTIAYEEIATTRQDTPEEIAYLHNLRMGIIQSMQGLCADDIDILLDYMQDPSKADLPDHIKDAIMSNDSLKSLYLDNKKPDEPDPG